MSVREESARPGQGKLGRIETESENVQSFPIFKDNQIRSVCVEIAKTTIAQRERCKIRIQRKKKRIRNQLQLETVVLFSVAKRRDGCSFPAILIDPSSAILIRASKVNIPRLGSEQVHVPRLFGSIFIEHRCLIPMSLRRLIGGSASGFRGSLSISSEF
jgi:hypothetical protein